MMLQIASRFALATLALALAAGSLSAEEAAKTEAAAEEVIVGTPPADSPFGKLKIGMTYAEVIAIVGKPSSESSWCTGKHRIPFYFGDDRGRAQALFKGMGKLDFNATISTGMFGRCSGDQPLDLVYIEFDPTNSGEAPK
jgi:ABC-type amino acid transport substrate-binding protein